MHIAMPHPQRPIRCTSRFHAHIDTDARVCLSVHVLVCMGLIRACVLNQAHSCRIRSSHASTHTAALCMQHASSASMCMCACVHGSHTRVCRFQAHMDAAILDQMRVAAVEQGDKILGCALRVANVFMLKRESIFARRLELMLEP